MTRTRTRTLAPAALLLLTAAAPLACGVGEGATGLPDAKAAPPKIPTPEPVADEPAAVAAAPAPAKTGPTRFVATVLPRESAELGPKMSGTLASISVDEGDLVKKGQSLFRVDPGVMRLQVEQAEAGLRGAQLARDEAQRELDRQRNLVAKGTVSSVVLERAQASFDAASNAVSQAEVGVNLSKRALGETSVISPISGVVARKLKNLGETVTMMPPTVVLVIQDQSALELRVRVPETNLRTIRPGGTLMAHFTALGVSRPATIARIMPTIDPVTRTVEVVAEVDNQDDLLRPGMYAEAEVVAAKEEAP